MSRDSGRQTAEIQIRIAIMNRFNSLDTAETEAVAGSREGRRKTPSDIGLVQQRPSDPEAARLSKSFDGGHN